MWSYHSHKTEHIDNLLSCGSSLDGEGRGTDRPPDLETFELSEAQLSGNGMGSQHEHGR